LIADAMINGTLDHQRGPAKLDGELEERHELFPARSSTTARVEHDPYAAERLVCV
jgi:hypothetical protein